MATLGRKPQKKSINHTVSCSPIIKMEDDSSIISSLMAGAPRIEALCKILDQVSSATFPVDDLNLDSEKFARALVLSNELLARDCAHGISNLVAAV